MPSEANLNAVFTDIANAIRTKKSSTNTIKPINMADEINDISGGLEINGLIEEYQVMAGENINAGDFIEIINNVCKHLTGSTFQYAPSCVLLEPNKVFMAYSYGSSYLYGTIVEINGTEMTATTTQLSSSSNECTSTPNCILLETNKVFIAHTYGNKDYLYGTIVTINGTTMTATTSLLKEVQYASYYDPNCVLLEPNKVFIAHSMTTTKYLYGTIVEINGTEMTATTTQLNSTSSSCIYNPNCVLLEPNKVFIAHSYTSSNYLYGTIVEINGTEMTATSIQLSSANASCNGAPSCVLLEPNKVFIAHKSSGQYIKGTIVTINGTEMTIVVSETISGTDTAYQYPNCILLETNKVFIAHSDNNMIIFKAITVIINGTEMTSTTSLLNGNKNSCYTTPSCVLLEPNKVFIAHSYTSNKDLYGTIYFGDKVQQLATGTIKGVAKTSGTGGDTIQMYVPNKE